MAAAAAEARTPRQRHGSMTLEDLLRREATAERADAAGGTRPVLAAGQAGRARKGEDYAMLKHGLERHPGASFSAFAMFDGHNGSAAAVYAKENLLRNVLGCVPADLTRDEWLAALPRALVAGFVKTDKDFQTRAHSSGTTVTLVIIDGSVVTAASVGDSRCVLEADGSIYYLSADHRFDACGEEVGRVTECGGEVGRLNVIGGAEIGPLRCWPGGLCLSRSIGDQDVGEFIFFFRENAKEFAFLFIEQEGDTGYILQRRYTQTHTRPSSPSDYDMVRRCSQLQNDDIRCHTALPPAKNGEASRLGATGQRQL